MRFSIDTLGCKVNHSESDFIAKKLLGKGLELVSWKDHPDFCIINTCTVTSQSDRKARQLIRRIKSKNKFGKIIVTGCFVVCNREFLKDINVDFRVNNKDKHKIPAMILKAAGRRKGLNTFCLEDHLNHGCLHSRPLVKIQDGCEQKCSYCIVPKVRGKYSSVPYREVLDRIKNLQKDGFEEIVLTGIHIGKYGIDFSSIGPKKGNEAYSLEDLLEGIISDTDIRRIRISSIEINEISSRLLDILKSNEERFASHLHIPLQSGSDRILKLMGRPYTSEYYFKKVETIGKVLPGTALAADVMAGFPCESEEDFIQTVGMVKKIAFSKIHVFKFSKRIHTQAYWMDSQVSEEIKSRRSKILRDIGNGLRNKYLKKNIGKVLSVVCEEIDDDDNIVSGTSENYIKVYFSKGKRDFSLLRGKVLKVTASSGYKNGLWGSVK
jgi:threonylcarbamoyladenosine tRNA methylthiotransferase MtaB